MKKWLGVMALLLCVTLLLAGCGDAKSSSKDTADGGKAGAGSTESEGGENGDDSSPYIGEKKALEIAEKHFGIKNGTRDEATGYLITYAVRQSPTEEAPTYVVSVQWLVEIDGQPSHQSTLDMVGINALTGEILSET